MVSFNCEACNDVIKKPKLDAHRGRCRNAVFSCIDCSTTFYGTDYRNHTSCISEEQKYQGALYREPKKKGQQQQKQQPKAAEKPVEKVVEEAKDIEMTEAPVEEKKEEVKEEVKEEKKEKKEKKEKNEKKEKKEKAKKDEKPKKEKKEKKDEKKEEETKEEAKEESKEEETPAEEEKEEEAKKEDKKEKAKKEKAEKKDKKRKADDAEAPAAEAKKTRTDSRDAVEVFFENFKAGRPVTIQKAIERTKKDIGDEFDAEALLNELKVKREKDGSLVLYKDEKKVKNAKKGGKKEEAKEE